MEFIQNIYIGDSIKSHEKIVKNLKKNKSISNIYCICIDEQSNSIFEIIHSREIFKKLYSNKNYIVIGIAESKNEAEKIICHILEDIYKRDSDLINIKKIILESLCKRGVNL